MLDRFDNFLPTYLCQKFQAIVRIYIRYKANKGTSVDTSVHSIILAIGWQCENWLRELPRWQNTVQLSRTKTSVETAILCTYNTEMLYGQDSSQ